MWWMLPPESAPLGKGPPSLLVAAVIHPCQAVEALLDGKHLPRVFFDPAIAFP